jgi:hypothetical protein
MLDNILFDEPNAFEKAVDYLDYVKERRVVSKNNEENLLKLLEHYFRTKFEYSPQDSTKQWQNIRKLILSLPEKS